MRLGRFFGLGSGVAALLLVIALVYVETRAPLDSLPEGEGDAPESSAPSRDGTAAAVLLANDARFEDSGEAGLGEPEAARTPSQSEPQAPADQHPLPPWPFAAARPALRASAFNGNPEELKPEFTVEQDFANESKDDSWSAQMEGRILAEVSQLADLELLNIEVDCRTTLCRLLLTFPVGTEIDQTSLAAGSSPRFTIGETVDLNTQFIIAGPDLSGTPVLLAYLRKR